MIKLKKNSINLSKTPKILAFLFLVSLFFPVRHVFLTPEAYLTGQYSDFTSFSLYLSDILILTTWFLVLMSRGRAFYHVVRPLKWLILVVFLSFIIHFGLNTRLNAFFLAKWLELIVAYGTLVVIIKEFDLKSIILKLFAWLISAQSIIALLQFFRQSPIGIFKLGESHIGQNIAGVAKIVSGGTAYIRAYGTFPHPNPLSATIVVGIFTILYLLITAEGLKSKTIYSLLLFLNILGLTVTFSRGAYLALGVGLIIFFAYFLWPHPDSDLEAGEGSQKRDSSASAALGFKMTPVIVILVSVLISFFLFKPFLLARATFSDQATVDRKFYDVTGIKMAEKNPIFGVGLGESVLRMEEYSGKILRPWEKQPPHNYFIIAAAEMGIPAALILLWIFLWQLKELILKLKFKFSIYYLLLATILCTFLVLMMFDHYFYTLYQTQLLLWLMLAMIAAEIKNPRVGD